MSVAAERRRVASDGDGDGDDDDDDDDGDDDGDDGDDGVVVLSTRQRCGSERRR